MKPKIFVLFLLVVFVFGYWIGFSTEKNSENTTGFSFLSNSEEITVLFCPSDNCDIRLIEKIGLAKESIEIAIYSFTLESVSDALMLASDNGVFVRVLFDSGQANSQYSVDEKLEEAGIPVKRMDLSRGVMHNKYIIIDEKLVGTGSFNYSKNGSFYNKENLVFINSQEIAEQFEADFESLWNAS